MSDDRRKSARLQGRFSNNPKESQHREKKNDQKNSGKNKGGNVKDQPTRPVGVEGINVEYLENSTFCVPELSKKKPEELRTPGITTLSETSNGKSEIFYEPNFLTPKSASEFYTIFKESTPWEQKSIIIHGESYPQPRLVAWYGELDYGYSGAILTAAEMPGSVLDLKKSIEEHLKEKGMPQDFNSVLMNYYRDEHDSVAWHSDDELSMGVHPTIASISLGEVREFHMRPKLHVKEVDPNTDYYVNLVPGSLLVMTGCMQKDWQHQIPKASHNRKGRINLTFRNVYPIKKNASQVPDLKHAPIRCTEAHQSSPVHNPDDFPSLGESIQAKSSTFSKQPALPSAPEGIPHCEEGDIQTKENVDPQTKENVDPQTKENVDPQIKENVDPHEIENHCGPSHLESESSSSAINPASAKEHCQTSENDSVLLRASSSAEIVSLQDDNAALDSKAHQFNVNAPDFVPSNPAFVHSYKHMSLEALAAFGTSNPDFSAEDVYDFWYHLEEKVFSEEFENVVNYRDIDELDTYSLLAANGLKVENQRLVNERVCKIIRNCIHKSKSFNKRSDLPRKPRNARGFRNRF